MRERERNAKENSREERARFFRKIAATEKNQQQIAKHNKIETKKINESRREVVKFYSMGAKSTFKIYSAAAPTNTHNVIQQTHSVTFKRAREDTRTHSKTDGRKDARARSLSL